MDAFLKRIGGSLDPVVFAFAVRTAIGACAALLLAFALGLEHPQWAAMTVWAASQPVRGQLLEKSFYRFAGTLAGVVTGVLMVLAANGSIGWLVVGLAVWIALCTALGHLVRGFLVYGVILSGYSASMVALLDNGDPALVIGLGIDRFLTIATGVAVALVIGLLFAPAGGPGALAQAIRQVTARLLLLMAEAANRDEESIREETRRLLADIAELEGKLEPHAAGSRKAHRFVVTARALFIAEVDILLHLRGADRTALAPEDRMALARASNALSRERAGEEALSALADVASIGRDDGWQSRIVRLRTALAAHMGAPERPVNRNSAAAPLVILHADLRGARSAALRALVVMLGVGGVWAATGWHGGPFLLLGLSIMISLFSTFENPARFMRNVMIGQCLGVAGALACRWLVWPLMDGSTLSLVLAMIPFILIGAPVMAHGRTRLVGFDYNMVMLLLLQPALPLHGTFVQSLGMAAAVLAAPALAFLAYRLMPVDARRRDAMLVQAMLAELKDMATSRRPLNARVRRARLHHRLLRLVQLGEKAGLGNAAAVDRGFAIYGLGEIVLKIRSSSEADGRRDRSLDLILARTGRIDIDPRALVKALDAASTRLGRTGVAGAGELQAAARALERQIPHLSRGIGK